jgi:hypothetical protein
MNDLEEVIIKQWIIDLRSGRYPQCRKSLKRAGSYCILGVLCKTVEEMKIVDITEVESGFLVEGKVVSGPLPRAIEKMLPFLSRNITLGHCCWGKYSKLNDNTKEPLSLPEIAEIIEVDYNEYRKSQ